MIGSATMPGQKDFLAYARFSPETNDFEAEGVKVDFLRDDAGNPLRGRYQIEMPPGSGDYNVEVQLLGAEPRRYSLKDINPLTQELRTFRYLDTPTMMEDTGFEMIVSVKTLDE
jgi:hypothetical protein